jgi:hypothetical protein
LWFGGTAAPLTITLPFHLLLPAKGPPLWLLWVGLTVSCTVLREVVNHFEKSAFGVIFE